ncbi:19063_t:CDS:1 [Funneliformis geosporum]|uniref:15571_t:CDS:1 n=1 Tax=Funneliformis geosporum TaxID=1117311 RepID=A0A9W4ST49_9GLOM|nr:15571_t:CDS:1 [Funneliformis geosporum]CAI2181741.1 19063_t:CDS:1 [Funneliformis geosporum]
MTTQQTLCTYPSYLSELFFIFRSPNSPPSSTYSQYPWPEELFIDRDGELFIHILTFLRNGTLPYSTPLSILQKLEYEATFYGIKPLQTLIYQRIQIHSSSPKFKVIPIERLSDEECDLEEDDEYTPRICLKRSNLSGYSTSSSYATPQQPDDSSIYSCSSSGDSSEEVPIIYNPGNTTSNTCNTVTPTTTCYTRTPKSSISTSNFTVHQNLYLSSVSAQHYDYKPDYEIISITNAPTINDLENLDQFHVPDEELYAKDLATFAVLQRKDK